MRQPLELPKRKPFAAIARPCSPRATSLEGNDLNGEIVLLGRLHGIATPVNAMLQQLGLRLVAEKTLPGTIPVAELERAVALA